MKNSIIIILLIMISKLTFGQNPDMQRVKIGDKLPDTKIHYSLDGTAKTIDSRALRGKIIILDFWNIWCGTCIDLMPEMERLNSKYKNDIQIFLVTNNSQKQIDDQFGKINARSKDKKQRVEIPSTLPSIVEDSIFHQFFPHISVPHQVWIDQYGLVKVIAFGADANEQAISDLIAGKEMHIPEKIDIEKFDLNLPLYQEGNGRQLKRLKYYSMIYKETREYMNASESKVVDSVNGIYRFRCMNNTIRNLFVKATVKKYQMTFNSPKRVILEVTDSSGLFWPKDRSKISKWRIENLHSYDLAIPLNEMDSVGSIMMQDLNRFLPYQATVEKRRTKCLALIRTNSGSGFIAKDGITPGLRTEKDGTLNLRGGTITDLLINGLGELNSHTNLPIVDDTGYSGKINIKLSNRRDLETVRKELRGYGLDFVEKTINLDMLVIRDKF